MTTLATESPTRRIKPLPAIVANQIAAGEVVERPASVVKELIENALDARASRVSVELDAGGIELVRVTDDGSGIDPADLPLALAPHATSKIEETADLDRIATLGFRGEALASIASVSRLSIRTRRRADTGATELSVEGETSAPARPASGPVGTSVTVRNLFFNTPARRKFLRTAQTERERCQDVFQQLAMAHPNVAFTLSVDGRVTHDYPADQSPRERALSVLGREVTTQVVEASADRFDDARGIVLWGLAGLPSLARGSTKGQFIFVNGRAVRDRTIQHAVSEAYRGTIEPGRYPTVVLMLDMSPEMVDVNVHPQKAEVRFRDGSMVHSVVLRALRDALATADLTPHAADLRPAAWSLRTGNIARDLLGASTPTLTGLDASALPEPTITQRAQRFAQFFQRFPERQTLLSEGDQRSATSDKAEATSEQRQATSETQPLAPAEPSPVAGRLSPVALLQVHNSYVITQDEQGVVIIDQHALHERAMFEYLLTRVLASGSLESQRMLMPVVVNVPPSQVALLDSLAPLLATIGLEAVALSPTSVGVNAFPSFLFERNVEAGEFMTDLLRKAEAGEFSASPSSTTHHSPLTTRSPSATGHSPLATPFPAEHALRDVLDMMSCKAAIKAGDRLSDLELAELVQLRHDVERSSNCPHGRPTSIRLTIKELERLFGRS